MLWRAHFIRTPRTIINLRSEANLQPKKGNKIAATQRSLHYQSNVLRCLGPTTAHNSININKKRYASTEALSIINSIPQALFKFATDKLTVPPIIEELTKTLTVEHCAPVEVFQNGLIYLHDCCSLPWWGAITIFAITVRLLLLPLSILAERNDARIANSLPQLQLLQLQLAGAKRSGNDLRSARLAQEIYLFKNYNELSLRNSYIATVVQAPVFVLFLAALRGMTNASLQSISQGGIFWFTDLTAADPTYVLPILTSATMCIIIEQALKSARVLTDDKVLWSILRACPFLILPLTVNFTAASLLYCTCNNLITLTQAAIFQNPTVRHIFRIEKVFHVLPNKVAQNKRILLKRAAQPTLNKIIYQEMNIKQRLDGMRLSKVRKDPLGKHLPAPSIKKVPPIPQRFKLMAIMDTTNIKF